MIDTYVQKIDNMEQTDRIKFLRNFSLISTIQQGIWLQYIQNPKSEAYNLGFLTKLNGDTNVNKFRNAIISTVSHHPIIRSFFYEDNQTENIHIIPTLFSNIRENTVFDKKSVFLFVEEKYSEPFDLKREIPIRIFQINSGKEVYFFFLFNHIAIDGRSLNIFKNDLNKYYFDEHTEEKDNLGYYFYIQQELESPLYSDNMKCVLQKFQEYYKDFEPQLIEWKTPEASKKDDKVSVVKKKLSSTENGVINSIIKRYNCFPFSIFQLCIAFALYKLKNVTNFIIGTTSENRSQELYQNSLGLFVNTLVVKSEGLFNQPIEEFLKEIDENFIKLISKKAVAYNKLAEVLDIPAFRVPIQVVLECQRVYQSPEKVCFEEIEIDKINRSSKFDLTIFVNITEDDEYSITFEYNSSIVDKTEIEAMWDIVKSIIIEIPKLLEYSVTLKHFKNKNYAKAILEGKKIEITESIDTLLYKLKNRSSVAILGDKPITFSELYKEAEQFSNFIDHTKTNNIVAIASKRNYEAIVMFFGAWLAKKQFMALSEDVPIMRLKSMLHIAKTDIVYSKDLSHYSFHQYEDKINCDVRAPNFQDVGYIIFSSGSTGTPKGVSIGSKSIMNLMYSLESILEKYNITKIALNADYAFDAFMQQVIQLLLGRSIYILTKEERLDIEKLIIVLNKYEIQQIDCTPSQLKLYFQEKLFEKVPNIKVVLVGGESIDEGLLSLIKKNLTTKFINVYGPCEATVDVTFKLIDNDTALNCIGSPILNTSIYILDKDHTVLQTGEIGEIVIQGYSVGHGYLNNIENKHGFCNIDLGSGVQPTYFTGDIGYINEVGEIFIKGRLDFQVKRNGVRIELEEIESVTKKIKEIEDAICYVPVRDKIVLFVKTQCNITSDQIKIYLKEYLADYMTPDEVIIVKKFLINASGKIDLKTMYLWDCSNATSLNTQKKEQFSSDEIKIASIWAKCLRINIHSIKKTSNFFSIGGNSLLAFKTLKEMRKDLNNNISISHLLNRSSLSEIAKKIFPKNDDSTNEKNEQNIFSINKITNESKKLIMFHPVGGGISCYQNLATYLEENNIEAIAVQDSFDSQSNSFNYIFEYADYLANSILYKCNASHLLGWSFGGILAFVVSLVLQKRGYKVETLTLVDTFFNEKTKHDFDDNFGLQAIINHLLIDNNQEIVDINQIPEQNNYLHNDENTLDKVYYFIQERIGGFSIDIKDFRRIVQIANHHRKLVGTLNSINLNKINVQINLIYASESIQKVKNILFEWQNFSTFPIKEYLIEANHYSIVKNPEVFSLVLSILNGNSNVKTPYVI